METEKDTSIEFFKAFALESGRPIDYTITPYPHTVIHAVTYNKRTVCVPFDESKEVFLLCYSDPKGIVEHTFFSGIFFKINLFSDTSVTFRKRLLFSRWFSGKPNSFAQNINREVHKNFRIDCNREANLSWTEHPAVINVFHQVMKVDERITVGINELNLDFCEDFKGVSHMGFYVKGDWLFDTEKWLQLLQLANKLKPLMGSGRL